jgi:GNAT superfamily N-acetyltransferase
MEYRKVDVSRMDRLWALHQAYKSEIHEEAPDDRDFIRLTEAVKAGQILFYGAWDDDALVGCCSVTVGFSTFNYQPAGVFEDFYILPEYRHRGIARALVQAAFQESGVGSLTVGCAGCDVEMYRALGFTVPLGNLLAFE